MKNRDHSLRFLRSAAARALSGLVLVCVWGLPPLPLQAVPFTVTGLVEIKSEGDSSFDPVDVNDSGQIAGTLIGQAGHRVTLFSNGTFIDLGLGDLSGLVRPAAVNNSGQVTGSFTKLDLGLARAFFHDGQTMSELRPFNAAVSSAGALNDSGQIVGRYFFGVDINEGVRGFLFSQGGATDLGTPSGSICNARAINNSGQIVGELTLLSGESFPFLISGGLLTDLRTLGANFNSITSINNSGQILGTVTASTGQVRSFLFSGGSMIDIGPGSPRDLNDHGHILAGSGFIHHAGEDFRLDELAAGFLSTGTTPGFRSLNQKIAISNNFIVGLGRFFDGTALTDRPFLLRFKSSTDFIWEGAEGFAFDHGPNWSDGVVPGTADTVKLTAPGQFKTIEFANGGAVTNQRLEASGGSRTEIDLNQSLWRIEPGAGGPEAAQQVLLRGADLTIKDGTLEVFGKVAAFNDGPASNGLSVRDGGKLIVRANALHLGVGLGGSQATSLAVQGNGSLIEAEEIVLASGSAGGSNATVSGGGFLIANKKLEVGSLGTSSAGLLATGDRTVIQVGEGGIFEVGTASTDGTVFVTDGAQAILNGAEVMLGEEGREGRFTASGAATRLFGGRFHVRPKGFLTLNGGQSNMPLLSVEGGEVGMKDGFFWSGNGELLVSTGTVRLDTGANARLGKLEVNGGALTIAQGGRLEITDDGGRTLVDGKFSGEDGEGSAAVPAVLEVTGGNAERKSQLVAAGELTIGFLGEGRMLVREGATAEVGQRLTIVGVLGSPALVEVGGAGSLLSVGELSTFGKGGEDPSGSMLRVEPGGAFSVRPNGGTSGSTTLRTGTSVSVGGTASLGNVTAEGGLLNVPEATGHALTDVVTVNREGLVNVTGGRLDSLRVTLNSGLLGVNSGGRLLVSEDMRLSDLTLVGGTGTTVETGGLRLSAPNGTLTVASGATFTVRPGEGPEETTLLEEGTTLTVTGTATTGVTRVDGGTLNVSDEDAVAIASLLTVNSGAVTLTAGRLETGLLTLSGGSLSGKSRVIGTVLNIGGSVAPGLSPGTLTIEGDYTQNGGTLVLEITGQTPGAQHDQLVVTGNVTLAGGTIELVFKDGFAPRTGQTFTFLDVDGTLSGNASFAVSGLQPGWQFDTAFNAATGAFVLTSLSDGTPNTLNFPDADDDGLPNDWETAQGLDPNGSTDAARDPDGDGLSNREEYLAGTDPHSAASAFKIISQQPYLGGSILTYTAQNGKTYRVTGSTDLKTWTELHAPSTSWATGPRTATITPAQAAAFPFFRVEIVP